MHSKKHVFESFNAIKEINKIYKSEGFFALYRGFLASFLSVHHSVIQFYLYETLKKQAAKHSKKSKGDIPLYYIMPASVVSKSNILIKIVSGCKFMLISIRSYT